MLHCAFSISRSSSTPLAAKSCSKPRATCCVRPMGVAAFMTISSRAALVLPSLRACVRAGVVVLCNESFAKRRWPEVHETDINVTDSHGSDFIDRHKRGHRSDEASSARQPQFSHPACQVGRPVGRLRVISRSHPSSHPLQSRSAHDVCAEADIFGRAPRTLQTGKAPRQRTRALQRLSLVHFGE